MRRQVREFVARRTNLVLMSCGMFLMGLVVSRRGLYVPLYYVVLIGLVGLAAYRRLLVRFVVLAIFFFCLGLWRGGEYLVDLAPYNDFAKQKVTIEITSLSDATYEDRGQLGFTAGDVVFISPTKTKARGEIRVKGFGELAVYKGDRLSVEGKLYPTRGAAQASISFAKITRIGSTTSFIDDFRRRFTAGVQTALPEPQASFAMGILIGQRNTLPDDITKSLKMIGLTHIIAVSGYNLTIIIDGARRLIGKRSKLASTIIAALLIGGFLALTGASASIVRAAFVSGLSLAAWYTGRKARPMVIILLSAALTAGFKPIYIWSDIGWYLSFLAFFGILMLAPQVFNRVWGDKKPPFLVQVAIETLCAEIMTIPLIMFIFGQVSLVGLLANVLVATMIPLAMLLSALAGLAGMLAPLLAGWIAWPASILLTYMLDTAVLLAKIPNSFHSNVYLSTVDMILCYSAILLILMALYRPSKPWIEK